MKIRNVKNSYDFYLKKKNNEIIIKNFKLDLIVV